MLDDIGIIAGEIWYYLEKNKEASVGKLTQEPQTNRSDDIARTRLVSSRRQIKNRKNVKEPPISC